MQNLSDFIGDFYGSGEDIDCNGDCHNCGYMDDCPDFEGPSNFTFRATNVYRTKNYIVRQVVLFGRNEMYGSQTLSVDTYFLRNQERDEQFDETCATDLFPDGRRLNATAYRRNYVK